MGYFTQTDLENALSVSIVKAAFDDDRDGEAETAPIEACIAYGTALCDSFLRKVGKAPGGGTLVLPLPSPPDEVKFAALDFGVAYAVRRRPDIAKAIGDQPWTVFYDQAVEQMKRYVSSLQMVTPTAMEHATVGGKLLSVGTGFDSRSACPPQQRWGSMGDFG